MYIEKAEHAYEPVEIICVSPTALKVCPMCEEAIGPLTLELLPTVGHIDSKVLGTVNVGRSPYVQAKTVTRLHQGGAKLLRGCKSHIKTPQHFMIGHSIEWAFLDSVLVFSSGSIPLLHHAICFCRPASGRSRQSSLEQPRDTDCRRICIYTNTRSATEHSSISKSMANA
jgi:hypothetical protein